MKWTNKETVRPARIFCTAVGAQRNFQSLFIVKQASGWIYIRLDIFGAPKVLSIIGPKHALLVEALKHRHVYVKLPLNIILQVGSDV